MQFIFFISLITGLGIIPCSYASQPASSVTADTAIERSVLVHINEYRKSKGLPVLQMNEAMIKEARKHSQDMARHSMPFGHKYFSSRVESLHAKIQHAGAAAENVAYNYKDAQDVVTNWLRSPGHKRNIVGNYNLTGIGIARDAQGKMYFTQIFLRTDKTTVQNRYRRAFSKN